MPIEIRVHPKFSGRVQRARIQRIAQKTLRAENAQASLTIYITTDAEMHALNKKFHATDAPTDVLSFPVRSARRSATESRRFDGTPLRSVPNYEQRPYLGDIAISYDTAKRQARAAGWHIADEIDLLAVHGILHLLGYDDLTPRKRAKMWQRQREILGEIAGSNSKK